MPLRKGISGVVLARSGQKAGHYEPGDEIWRFDLPADSVVLWMQIRKIAPTPTYGVICYLNGVGYLPYKAPRVYMPHSSYENVPTDDDLDTLVEFKQATGVGGDDYTDLQFEVTYLRVTRLSSQ